MKFTEEGGVSLVARSGSREDSDKPVEISIEITDTGPGMAPDELDQLFEPFVQTDTGEKSQEGTGLGLPISRQFAQLMGGGIEVRTAERRGPTFIVTIPVSLATEEEVKTVQDRPRQRVLGIESGQTAPDGGPYRILIVEDKRTNRTVLEELHVSFGLDVKLAVNGEEGVKAWESWAPHLIWMDMRMPVMDGYEASRLIKEKAATAGREILIVALTARAFEEDREAILQAGCEDLVRKPFRRSEICDVLNRFLGLRFTYEAVDVEPKETSEPPDFDADLKRLPAGWAKRVHAAIAALDVKMMRELIGEVDPISPQLAATLRSWFSDFQYERIVSLIDKMGQSEKIST